MAHPAPHGSAGPQPALLDVETSPPSQRGPVPAAVRGIHILREDVLVLALASRARLDDLGDERERDALLSEVYGAALDLARCLGEHTRHSLMEYRGSHSAWDVVAESEALFAAQERYADVARRAAERLRVFVGVPHEEEG